MNNNKKTVDVAIDKLKKLVQLDLKAEVADYDEENRNVKLDFQGIEKIYQLEVMKNITDTAIGYIKVKGGNTPNPVMIIAGYVPAHRAEKLKAEDIQFIDMEGNAYINNFPVYIYTRGNKPEKVNQYMFRERAFTKKEMRIVFVLLNNPEMVNNTYRNIADKAKAGLGTTARLMKKLKAANYIIKTGNKRKLIKDKELLEKWVKGYPEILKPGLFMGRFAGPARLEEMKKLNKEFAIWGGEAAAAIKTGYLKPQILTIYTAPDYFENIIVDNRLKKAGDGNIEIFKCFWKREDRKGETVPPLLIYADLIAEGNKRDVETAGIVYEKYLRHFK